MAQCYQLYKTKVRDHNKIYQVILLQGAFEDLHVNGIASSVVNSLDANTSVAMVIGNFKHPVEILSVHPWTDIGGGGDVQQAGKMYLYILFLSGLVNIYQLSD